MVDRPSTEPVEQVPPIMSFHTQSTNEWQFKEPGISHIDTQI
jgi:hypothetical protein